jgi:nicotinate dehydrogenase subunit B
MTGLLHEKEFSRKSFLKRGGALIIGFSVAGAGLAGTAKAAGSPLSPFGSELIDPSQIDSWLVIHSDNTATIKSGAVQQGNGSDTSILQIAGEELGMDMSQLSFAVYDTSVTPNTGGKGASNTIYASAGRGTRAAAASAYQTLLGLASTQLGVPVSQLSVSKGVVSGGGKTVTYGSLIGDMLFNVQMPASWNMQVASSAAALPATSGLQPGKAPAKPVSQYKLVGTSPPRTEIPAIANGSFVFIQNIRIPGMQHGRIVRPIGQAVYGFGPPVISVDERSIAHLPNVKIVRVGDFLGVVAPHEYDAIQAAAQLKVKWADPPAVLPGGGNEFNALRAADKAGKTVLNNNTSTIYPRSFNTLVGDVDGALASAAHVVAQTYAWPTNVHTPIGPSCCIADVTPQGVRVFSGTQGAYTIRSAVASVLGLPVTQVRATAAAMGGVFGSAVQYDTAQAAALMSRAVGAPVRVQMMRWDEIGQADTSPGTVMDIRAGVDGLGNIVGYDHTQFYPQYISNTYYATAELAGVSPATRPSAVGGVFPPSAMYKVPNNRWLHKSIPLLGNWVRCAYMRCGNTPMQTWATEQVIDELARASGKDPAAFRRQNVTQDTSGVQLSAELFSGADTPQSMLAVLDSVTKAANWQPKVAASQLSDKTVVSGRGLAWSNVYLVSGQTKSAAIADVEVNKKTGKITVKHVYQAFSAGLIINPEFVENQIVGGVVQILSRLLVEELRFSKTHVTSSDFVTYPIMRFKDAPAVTPIVLQQPDVPPSGIGEPVTQVAAAAVANAFFDATGVRLYTAPYTPARVRAALKAAGVA